MIKEAIEQIGDLKLNTAGYILEDGSLVFFDYHGEESDSYRNKGLPEFSNTHPEDDTCIRLYSEPNEKQYQKIEQIIDVYLDMEGYCKLEIWSGRKYYFYKIYSLWENACDDTTFEEEVGNWTGYKLIRIIKNYFNNLIEKIVKKGNKWQVQSEKGRNLGTYDTEEEAKKRLKQVHYFSHLNEEYLVEVTRQELLNKSKNAAKYKGKNTSRWTAKSKCSVANTVRDYNQIDMNRFWKDDVLKFVVKVKGETDTYDVTVEFSNLSEKIQGYVKAAKNLFNRDIVTKALMNALSSSDVKISCSCPDFRYRLSYWSSREGAKSGEQETRASNITNPNDNLGLCCKHILAVLNNVYWMRNVGSVIVNYANYCKEFLEYNYSRFIFPKIYGVQYNQAVQMCMNDFDSDGDPIDELKTSKELINLANAIAKARFKNNKSKADIEKAQKELEDKEKEEQEQKDQETNNTPENTDENQQNT